MQIKNRWAETAIHTPHRGPHASMCSKLARKFPSLSIVKSVLIDPAPFRSYFTQVTDVIEARWMESAEKRSMKVGAALGMS